MIKDGVAYLFLSIGAAFFCAGVALAAVPVLIGSLIIWTTTEVYKRV